MRACTDGTRVGSAQYDISAVYSVAARMNVVIASVKAFVLTVRGSVAGLLCLL